MFTLQSAQMPNTATQFHTLFLLDLSRNVMIVPFIETNFLSETPQKLWEIEDGEDTVSLSCSWVVFQEEPSQFKAYIVLFTERVDSDDKMSSIQNGFCLFLNAYSARLMNNTSSKIHREIP